MAESIKTFRSRADGTSWSGCGMVVDEAGFVAMSMYDCPTSGSMGAVEQIEDAIFGKSNSTSKTTFASTTKVTVLDAANTAGNSTFMNGVSYDIMWETVPGTPYKVVVIVTYADMEKLATDLLDEVNTWLTVNCALALTFASLLLMYMAWQTRNYSNEISKQISILCDNMQHANQAEFVPDIVPAEILYSGDRWTCSEMDSIEDKLVEMQVALRYSNVKYHMTAEKLRNDNLSIAKEDKVQQYEKDSYLREQAWGMAVGEGPN